MPQTDKSRRIHPPSDTEQRAGGAAESLMESAADFYDRHPLLTTAAALSAGLLAGALMSRLMSGSERLTFGRRLAKTAADVGEGLRERASEFAEASSEFLANAGDGAGKAAKIVAEKSSASFASILQGLSGIANLALSIGLGRMFAK